MDERLYYIWCFVFVVPFRNTTLLPVLTLFYYFHYDSNTLFYFLFY